MFIDYVVIKLKSGKGGDGACTFRQEKYVDKGGPDGGDGGRGGHIYVVADHNLTTLIDFHYNKNYHAKDGGKGSGSNCHGRNAQDTIMRVPVGTLIRDNRTKRVIKDMVTDGEQFLLTRGGRGGKGNTHYKSSTRQTPRFYEKGEPGIEMEVIFELKILADAGIIGMANAGKSTLLSRISNAKPKIAAYPFTTLQPNLGIVKYGEFAFVVADIPGLIEGAHDGKGLGIEFLRHIERTKTYIHVVDPTQGSAIENFKIINNELKAYDKKLAKRPQVVIVNKVDLLTPEEIKQVKKDFKKKKVEPLFISAKDNIGLEKVIEKVYNIIKALPRGYEEHKADYEEQKDILTLQKVDEKVYILRGKRIERYVAMHDFKEAETFAAFKKFLEASGIDEFLRLKGVKEGDVIVIGEMDFVYEE